MSDERMTPEHDEVARRLEAERPVPRAAFRGELRRHLVSDETRSPRRLRLLVAAYSGSGLALLAVAAIGVAGGGPLAS